MKTHLIMLFAIVGQLCYANMSSPFIEGTKASDVFTSRDVDILKEKIFVKINNDHQTATYIIEYRIKAYTEGEQIPLLFYAINYKENFHVRLDNKEIQIRNILSSYKTLACTQFNAFSGYFKLDQSSTSEPASVFEEYRGHDRFQERMYERINELKYFETKLQKGEHTIRIEYIANQSRDRSNWVNEYSFNYSLAPARYWKSFGSLEITVDATSLNTPITTNLGQPVKGKLDSIASWYFNELPDDFFRISYTPRIGRLASVLITVSPFGLSLIITLLMIWLHLCLIRIHRKNIHTKKYSWVVITGSILIPFFTLLIFVYSFDLIDMLIGTEASRYHGYTFFVWVLYPFLLSIYMTIMWKIDKSIRMKSLQ